MTATPTQGSGLTRRLVRGLIPVGLVEANRRRRAFAKLNFSPLAAARAAFSSSWITSLNFAGLDSMPSDAALGSVFVDVGAEIGAWSSAALRLAGPDRLLALEPAPASFEQLKSTIGDDPRVELRNVAAGRESGRMTFRIMSDSLFNSFYRVDPGVMTAYPHVRELAEVEVDVRPLDELTAGLDAIAILKIDVQGAEREVLAGARETLRRTRCVLIEANFVPHYEHDMCFDELHRSMTGFGFDLLSYVHPYHVDGRLMFANAVYVQDV